MTSAETPDALLALIDTLPSPARLLLIGPSGSGKSTLATAIASQLASRHGSVALLHADPGRPMSGPPGTLSLHRFDTTSGWQPLASRSLASMDCLRYRAPLLALCAELFQELDDAAMPLIVDTPGVSRGAATVELLGGLLSLARGARPIVLEKNEAIPLTFQQIFALHGASPLHLSPHPLARRPSKSAIQTERLARWQEHVGERPALVTLPRHAVQLLLDAPDLPDAQLAQTFAAAIGARGEHLGLVLLRALDGQTITLELPDTCNPEAIAALVVRDLVLSEDQIKTRASEEPTPAPHLPTATSAPLAYTPRERPILRVNFADAPAKPGSGIRATMVGHLFEDPMCVLRLDHRQRCLFLDLGEVRQVPTRLVHQTTDLLITHAHLDHFGDFTWLLRRLSGHVIPMRLFGPPGIAARTHHMIEAFTWDRVEERGARFEIFEIFEDHLLPAFVQAGIEGVRYDEPITRSLDGVILDEPRLVIRATTLDHGGIPTIAYSIEESHKYDVKGSILKARGWQPGQWLGELKTLAAMRRFDDAVSIPAPDGTSQPHRVGDLFEELLIERRGQKIVYATDFATHSANHEALVRFAHEADVFICEASFAERDRDQAERTGHMCARNTARIAREANVRLLVPFHLSVRYESDPAEIYRELVEEFEQVLMPAPIAAQLQAERRAARHKETLS